MELKTYWIAGIVGVTLILSSILPWGAETEDDVQPVLVIILLPTHSTPPHTSVGCEDGKTQCFNLETTKVRTK